MPGRRILTISGRVFCSIFDGHPVHAYAHDNPLPGDARVVEARADEFRDEVYLTVESSEWTAVSPYPEHIVGIRQIPPVCTEHAN